MFSNTRLTYAPRPSTFPGQLAPSQHVELAGEHARKVDDLKLLPTAGDSVSSAKHVGGQRPCGSRVRRSRQRDLGKKLNARTIGKDPQRGPQFVDHPRPADIVGHQHRAAALAYDLEPFAALVRCALPAANRFDGRPAEY